MTRNSLPTPGVERISTLPLADSTLDRTASRPTPRPETSVTNLVVEKPDLTLAERALLVPAIALMFLLGLWPQLVLGVVNSTVVSLVAQLNH